MQFVFINLRYEKLTLQVIWIQTNALLESFSLSNQNNDSIRRFKTRDTVLFPRVTRKWPEERLNYIFYYFQQNELSNSDISKSKYPKNFRFWEIPSRVDNWQTITRQLIIKLQD